MDAPPKGSRLARYVELITANDAKAHDEFLACQDTELRRHIYAPRVQILDPDRPWKWPIEVSAERLIRPVLHQLKGEAEGDVLFQSQPALVEYMAWQEVTRRFETSTQEERNGKPPCVRGIAKGFVMAALNDEVQRAGPLLSENALCVAVAKRLGPGVTREVVRRVFRQLYLPIWGSPGSDRSRLIIMCNYSLQKWMKKVDREIARGCVRNPRQYVRGNAQTRTPPS